MGSAVPRHSGRKYRPPSSWTAFQAGCWASLPERARLERPSLARPYHRRVFVHLQEKAAAGNACERGREYGVVWHAAAVGDAVQFPTPDGQGQFAGVVLQVAPGRGVLFDFNHPLAGQPVTFEVQLIGIL